MQMSCQKLALAGRLVGSDINFEFARTLILATATNLTHTANLHALTSAQLVEGYRKKEISPVDAASAAFAQIALWEPKVNAMYLVQRDQAMTQAKASEARWLAGAPISSLDGVPITLKENLYTKGDPAPIGTGAMSLAPKEADSPVAARVREAGMVMLGKTTMPDFGMLSAGQSSVHGITRSAWRRDRNTSGSSSGAAAAVVAGYGPMHVGTDIGGSVRLPATHGGFFALKPSAGRVPVSPPFMGRVAGPMTRTVDDSARLLNIITGPDNRDYMNIPYEAFDYSKAITSVSPDLLKGLRIGYLANMNVGLDVNPEVAAAVAQAASVFAAAGAKIEPMNSFLTADMLEGMCRFFEVRSFADVSVMPAEQRAKILPFVLEWCTYRAGSFTGVQVMQAYNQVLAMREATVNAVAQYDFVLSPVSPIPAYEAELPSPNNDPHNALPHIAFTVAYNMSENPASSTNWSYTADGMPIGVQIVGQRFDDVGVMKMSRVVELLRPQQREWPQPW